MLASCLGSPSLVSPPHYRVLPAADPPPPACSALFLRSPLGILLRVLSGSRRQKYSCLGSCLACVVIFFHCAPPIMLGGTVRAPFYRSRAPFPRCSSYCACLQRASGTAPWETHGCLATLRGPPESGSGPTACSVPCARFRIPVVSTRKPPSRSIQMVRHAQFSRLSMPRRARFPARTSVALASINRVLTTLRPLARILRVPGSAKRLTAS